MSVIVVNQRQVRELLPMDVCIDLMESALVSLGEGRGANPLRWAMRLPAELGILGMMPGALDEPATFGLKIIAVLPRNHGTGYDSHQGVVLLFDPERGFPTAIVDASEITAIRTAAVSGLATRLLAREDAGDLAILGSGVQARTHLEAMLTVRKIRRVRVWSPTESRLRDFTERQSARHGIQVEAMASAREAVINADLICTVTSSEDPVLAGAWLSAGAHINAAGSSVATARELDTAAMQRCRLFVDRRESTLNEAGDFLIPKAEGVMGDDHILAELGEISSGQAEGRRGPREITLFKSLGLAVEDLASAHYVAQRARQAGIGSEVEIGELPVGGA